MDDRVTPQGVHAIRRLLDFFGRTRAVKRPHGNEASDPPRDGTAAATPEDDAVEPEREQTDTVPSVSIIIPIYNVEEYLRDCLDSVLAQEFTDFEAVVIDDGSPDGSAAIAREYADRDDRVRVVSRANGGLGAARNTGVRQARGRFLTFLDSDDEIPPGALRRMMESAEESGSDMVVGSLRRFNSIDRWKPGWVDDLHGTARTAITIGEHPPLVRNNYTVAKLYRREFWDEAGLWFREGVSYEDQPLVTQLYVRARAIDVVRESVYRYRARDDRSSISQQTATVADLRDRIAAWRISAEEFSQNASEVIYRAWLTTLFDAHFHWYLRSPSIADDEYWSELHHAIVDLTANAPREVWESVAPDRRVVIELARQKRREDIVDFYARDGARMTAHPAEPHDGGVRCLLPFVGDPTLPDWLFTTAREDLVVEHQVHGFRWLDGLRARVTGWAYVRQIDLAVHSTQVDLVLRHDPSGAEEVFGTETDERPAYRPPVENDRIDYGAGAFDTTVDLRPCAERCLREGGRWAAHLRVTTGSVSREIPVRRLIRSSSAGVIPVATHPDGHRVLVDWRMGEQLQFEVAEHRVAASSVHVDRGEVAGELDGPAASDVVAVDLVDGEGEVAATVDIADEQDAPFSFSLAVPEVDTSELSPDEFVAWHVRARLRSGEEVPVASPAERQLEVVDAASGAYGIERTREGTLAVRVWRVVALADSVDVDERDVLHIEGRVHGIGAAGPLRLRLRGRKSVEFSDELRRADDGTFTVAIPLQRVVGRFGPCALPTGAHDAALFLGDEPDDHVRVPVLVSGEAGSRLPVPVATGRLEGRLIRGPENRVRLHLDRPLGEARGRYRQHQLRTTTRHSGELRSALLIRSYFGESATCNGVGIVRELRRRGSDLDVFWSVRDHSVPVPDGAEPVVMRSREWYDLLGSATYYLDNMFQPTFHRKPPGQVLVQTFHGYPFKTMGRQHWEQTLRSPQAIEEYERRAAEWDYLVSPAAYATPLLRRDFAYDGDVLEIGYPRNDVLQSPEADGIRSAVRALFGIRPDQRAILYAPTFRDYESPDDFRAAMVDLLDLEAVADALGDAGVLLVRGHAFNARAGQNIGERPGIVDVTDYPEVSDLYLAADAAIVDYSSLRFDFAVTGKPMIFHVPDLQRYRETRGWVVDFERTAPGPHVSTTDEVIERVRDLDGVRDTYREQYERFGRDFIELDDGRASERFVDAVMVPRGDAPPG